MDTQETAKAQTAYNEAETAGEKPLHPVEDMLDYLRQYARENPEVAALTCFGVGFVLGWKLKLW